MKERSHKKQNSHLGQPFSFWPYWVCLGLLLLFFSVIMPPGSATAGHIKPGISTELGYTDNVKFRTGEDDFFFRITPRLDVSAGPPENNFTASASVGWTQYFVHTEESDIENANISLAYNRAFSPRFNFNISNVTSVSYDPIQNDDEGQPFFDIRPGTRQDTNTTTANTEYRWSEFDLIHAQYRFRWTNRDDDDSTQSTSHRVRINGQSRVTTHWRLDASLEGGRAFYEDSENYWTTSAEAGIVRMIGPNREAFLRLSTNIKRADTDDPDIAGSTDYDVYNISTGANWAFSPVFKAGFSAGVQYVDGDEELNSAAGDLYPQFSFFATYTGQTWSLSGNIRSSLEDFVLEGRDTGLEYTTRASIAFNWNFMQHWSFDAGCSIFYTEPLQDITALTSFSGDERITYTASAGLNWQMTKYSNLGLRYKFEHRDSDSTTDDDRTRNEVSLIFTTYHDFMW